MPAVCGTLAEHLGAGWAAIFGIGCAAGVAALLAGARGKAVCIPAPDAMVNQPLPETAQEVTP